MFEVQERAKMSIFGRTLGHLVKDWEWHSIKRDAQTTSFNAGHSFSNQLNDALYSKQLYYNFCHASSFFAVLAHQLLLRLRFCAPKKLQKPKSVTSTANMTHLTCHVWLNPLFLAPNHRVLLVYVSIVLVLIWLSVSGLAGGAAGTRFGFLFWKCCTNWSNSLCV